MVAGGEFAPRIWVTDLQSYLILGHVQREDAVFTHDLDREIPAARILLETLVHRVNSPVIHVAR
jgi:hypothetical protein